ncbi:MAG: rod shape-determining protein MreC [Patescibacteria group bacterium]|nr:rod shape-determining protein MreC [Patescibacteria group bacterium]
MFRFLRSISRSVIYLAAVILLIFLHYIGILKPLEDFAIFLLTPIQASVYRLGGGINQLYTGFPGRQDLAKENSSLTEQVNKLIVENSQLKMMIELNSEVSVQQKFLEHSGLKAITATIIGRNPEPNLQSIIIDKGSNDGIKPDLPLITADGVMVGKILKVKGNSSEAILVNDSRSRIAAVVQNEAGSKGAVIGEHGLSLKMELIPQNDKVSEGDVAITSGIEPNIPRGLVIGTVSRVITEANGFFQTALLQSPVKINNLIVVSIVTNTYDN